MGKIYDEYDDAAMNRLMFFESLLDQCDLVDEDLITDYKEEIIKNQKDFISSEDLFI